LGTTYFGLPQVDPDSTLSFPDAVNGLATATDAVLHGIQKGFEGDEYEPPIASRDTLGVVRVGHGFKVYADGLITRSAEPFRLEPATDKKLGGIVAGRNITADEDGRIGIGSGAFSGTEQIKTSEIAAGAVTTAKLATPAIVEGNVDSTVVNKLKLPSQMWNSTQVTEIWNLDSNRRVVNFHLRKLTNKIAIVVPFFNAVSGIDRDEGIGQTLPMYTSAGLVAPGSLWSGTATIQAAILGNSQGGTYDSVIGYRTYILDFDNSTITQPEDNVKLSNRYDIATFSAGGFYEVIMTNVNYAILVKE
jgi:hypothetical protein